MIAPSRTNLIPCFVGCLLITATGLKLHQHIARINITNSIWFDMALIQVELMLGFVLLFGLYPKLTRIIAITLFSGFLVFSFHQAAAGSKSCACFGKWSPTPWFMVGLDSVILLLLYAWKPLPHKTVRRTVAYTLLALPICITPLLAWPTFAPSYPQLETSPTIIDLGRVEQGSLKAFRITATNPYSKPV